MLFVLIDNFVTKLRSIRTNYQERANVILDESKQPYAISLFFGAKDVTTRNTQIDFIEKWLMALEKELSIDKITEEDLKNLLQKNGSSDQMKLGDEDEQGESSTNTQSEKIIEEYLTALRVLVTVCMYVKSQIDGTYIARSGQCAILEQLMNEAMGITSSNILDKETKACCLLETKCYLLGEGNLKSVNAKLKDKFSAKQWSDFLDFVTQRYDAMNDKYKTNFPVKNMMMPLMSKPLEFAGYTTGFIIGEMVGQSAKLMPAHLKLSAAIGSGLVLLMGPSAGLGISLLVPTYAGRILNTYCGVSLAWLLGTAGNITGQGLGLVTGLTIDVGWKLMYNSVMLLASLYSGRGNPEQLNGLSLKNGHRVINGVELKFVDMNTLQLPPNYKLCPVKFEVHEDALKVTVNDEHSAIVPLEEGKQALYLEELKKLFASQAEKEEKSIITQDVTDNSAPARLTAESAREHLETAEHSEEQTKSVSLF
ncbi:Dot/Icm secretion system substrate [Legionella hackeliae]|nr:substrate of the Dot/Icm secretion system [Legionella hackeliae]STX47866.1 Dot/Icm secretion system substrate [Legionella hackeliae]